MARTRSPLYWPLPAFGPSAARCRLLRPLLTSALRSGRLTTTSVPQTGTQRRPPEVRSTAFTARPPDLPPRPLMTVDFAISGSLVRPGRPRYPVFVHRAAALLHAFFRPHLAMTPLRFANPSPPSGWIEDFHLQAVVHARRTKKKARLTKRAFENSDWTREPRSSGLAVDLRQIVLRGLGAFRDELAEIFGGGLGARDENFAAGADHVRLDLGGFAQRLGGSELVDAGEERLGVLIERLLDVAADFGGFGDRTGDGGLDRSGHLLGAGVQIGSANLGGLSLLLHELAGGFRNFQVLKLGERFGDGRESLLDAVELGIGFGGHGGSLHPQVLSYGLTPSGL